MDRNLQFLSETAHDVLVVGGGIHGAAVAWVASLAGLSVAVVERDDFAQATSAQSQKIIHGGLRYLQDLDFGRSLQSIRDRSRLLWIAPHLAHPMACVIPLEGFAMRGPEVMRAGLLLYRALSALDPTLPDSAKRLARPRVMGRQELMDLVPSLPAGGVRGGALWSDGYVYHTERLVLAFLRSACRAGAAAANYAEAGSLRIRDGRCGGAEILDRLSGGRFEVRAKWVVDCTGPWEGRLWRRQARPVRLVGGINLVTRPLHPAPVAVGVRIRSGAGGRFYFVSPWRGCSIVGTEWVRHEGSPETFRATEAMIDRFIGGFNRAWPAAGLRREDVLHMHCGLVPADDRAWDRGEDAPMPAHSRVVDRSRQGVSGLLSVMGVKYTTAVSVAADVVRRIRPGFRLPATTRLPRLVGGEIPDWSAFLQAGEAGGMSADVLSDYGTEAAALGSAPGGLLEARVRHALDHEMAQGLGDVVVRRTGLAVRGCPSDDTLRAAAGMMAARLGWDAARTATEVANVKKAPGWRMTGHARGAG